MGYRAQHFVLDIWKNENVQLIKEMLFGHNLRISQYSLNLLRKLIVANSSAFVSTLYNHLLMRERESKK